MGGAEGVSEPKHLALDRFQLGHGAPEIGAAFETLGDAGIDRHRLFIGLIQLELLDRMARLLAIHVPGDVRGDAEERIAPMAFVLMRGAGFVETIERLLQQVVGQIAIARDACQVNPDRPRGALVKRAETLLVHQPRGLGIRARAGNREQRIVHDACEIHRVNDPMSHSAGASAVVAAAVSHRPSLRERTYETTPEMTKPIPIEIARTPMAYSGCDTVFSMLPLTYVRPQPAAASTSPTCTDQRMRPIGALTARGTPSSAIGADSRKRFPAGVWMYASKSSFAVRRSINLLCTSA